MNKRDEQLFILKLQNRDTEAFTELYNVYSKPIYRFVFFRTSDEGIAEDIMQEVFVRFIAVPDKQHITNVRSYLYQIARNLIVDFYKSRSKKVIVDIDQAGELISHIGKQAMESAVDLEFVIRALFKIKPIWRELLFLRFVEHMELHEIAQTMGKSENYVRVNIHRAQKKLTTFFE